MHLGQPRKIPPTHFWNSRRAKEILLFMFAAKDSSSNERGAWIAIIFLPLFFFLFFFDGGVSASDVCTHLIMSTNKRAGIRLSQEGRFLAARRQCDEASKGRQLLWSFLALVSRSRCLAQRPRWTSGGTAGTDVFTSRWGLGTQTQDGWQVVINLGHLSTRF